MYIDYKDSPDSEYFNKQDARQNSTDSISINYIDQHISNLKNAYIENNLPELNNSTDRIIADLHQDKKIIDFILQTDLLDFLANSLTDEPSDKMYQIVNLLEYLLFTNNENVTLRLIENNGIANLNSFLDVRHGDFLLSAVIDCIGYAMFDIIKLQSSHVLPPNEFFIHFEKDAFQEILTTFPQLTERVLNMLFNSLSVLIDYDLTVRTLLFFIFLIDIDQCPLKYLTQFFKLLVTKIKYAHDKKIPDNFPFEIFAESQLSDIFVGLFLNERFQSELYTPDTDVFYWAAKLMIIFLKNDTEDNIFLKKIAIIQPEDYLNIIFQSNSTDASIKTIFHILILICKKQPQLVQSIATYQDPKTGKNRLLDYQYNLEIVSYHVKVWYLRFLSILIDFGIPEVVQIFFTGEFVEIVLNSIDPENIPLSKSCFEIFNSLIQLINSEGHFFMIDIFHELNFNEVMDEFLDEVTDEGLQDFGNKIVKDFSKAEYAATQT